MMGLYHHQGREAPPTGARPKALCAVLLAATLLPVLLLNGCGTSSPTAYYTLEPMPPAPAAAVPTAYSGPPVQVLAVHLPPALDRLEVLHETAPGQFDVNEFAHWAAPLARMARQTLTEDLLSRLPQGAVVFPDAQKPDGASVLSVDLLSFRAMGGSIQADASWSYRSGLHPEQGWHTHSVRLTTAAGDGQGTATAHAFSDVMGQLSDRIAVDLAAAN